MGSVTHLTALTSLDRSRNELSVDDGIRTWSLQLHVVTIDADGTIVQLDWSALGRGGHQRPDKRRLAHLQHNVMKNTSDCDTRAIHVRAEYLKELKKKAIYYRRS